MQNAFQTLIMLDFSFHVSRKGGFLTVFLWILLFWAPAILWSLSKNQISMWNNELRNWVTPANHNKIICKICLFQISGHLYVNGWVIVIADLSRNIDKVSTSLCQWEVTTSLILKGYLYLYGGPAGRK